MFFQWTRGVNKYRLSLKSKAKNKTSNYNFYKRRQKGKHSGFTYGLDGLYFRVGISNLWREKNCRTHGGGTMVQTEFSSTQGGLQARAGRFSDSHFTRSLGWGTPAVTYRMEKQQGLLLDAPLLLCISSCPGLEYLFPLGSWQTPTQGSKSCSEVPFQG